MEAPGRMNEHGHANRVSRRAAASAVASCGRYNEFLLQMRFGHSTEVANAHYRRAQFGAMMSGDTVEEWLGVKAEISSSFARLGW
jgi:hypothetical protein